MSGPRVGDRELAASVQAEADTTGAGERFGAALASPVGILLIVPGLVAAVGLLLTVLGQTALRESTTQLGRDRFAEQTQFVAHSIAASLAHADPMLDRLTELAADWSPDAPPGPIAHALRGLMRARPGVAYASISYTDGTFQGAFQDGDGVIRYKEARGTGTARVMTTFDIEGVDAVVPRKGEATDYDPRTRDFYLLAAEHGRRVWTKPYPFYSSHQTGVTRAQPLYEAGGGRRLRAVLTTDFDVHALSGSMAHTPLAGARTLLFTADGTLLAHPEGAARIAKLPVRRDRALSLHDLGDPVVDAFFALARARATQQPIVPGTFEEIAAGDERALAMVMPVPRFPELGWTVAAIVPQSAFFRARDVHERQSLIAASIALLAALGVAVVFARHVVRVRRAVAHARDLARKATDRARDLGSYRLVERLGQGGMGEVWRAEHRLLVRQAAIKLIREEMLASAGRPPAELRERFRREAQTLARLRSRHTIELFDYGVTEEGTFYFVMELLDGIGMDALVERHGPQPPARVIHLLLQACSSLAEAHAAGLVHRDVKPANLFVCRAADEVDIVKVLDFGLVKGVSDSNTVAVSRAARSAPGMPADPRLTRLGQHVGTPACMAPEQVRGEPIDGRADIYSLGCVAVWLLSGRMPFEAETAVELMAAHLYTPLPDLSALVPGGLPPELDAVLRRCLAKERDDRPRDVRALSAALRAVVLPPGERWGPERAHAWWTQRMTPGQPVEKCALCSPTACGSP